MNTILQSAILRSSTKQLQVGIAIPVGFVGGYLLINLLTQFFDQKLFFKEYLPLAIILFVVLVILQIVVWYRSRGSFTIDQLPDGEYKVEISFPNGTVLTQKGKWSVIPTYTKTYARYGMYYKNLALTLYCNDEPFCLLRHQLGGIHTAPEGFIEVGELINTTDAEFWCKKLPAAYDILRK